MSDKSIINCHTHIFTGDCVPPWLAKTFLPGPSYLLLPTHLVVRVFRWWYNSDYSPYKWKLQPWHKTLKRELYKAKMLSNRVGILRLVKAIVVLFFILSILGHFHFYNNFVRIYLLKWGVRSDIIEKIHQGVAWIKAHLPLYLNGSLLTYLVFLILLLILYPSGKNLLLFILRNTSKFFKMLPGKKTKELLERYILIIRFARYKEQSGIFGRLCNQYPPDTKIVVLPMDMENMGAGKPPKPFDIQMNELRIIKANHPDKIYPFVFVDPRRKTAGTKPMFDYRVENGEMLIDENCFVKEYIEDHQFSGLKIYPALGYFPFDENLLALWKYAADNNIPVMTHCIRGVIYYRGAKKAAWDFHPVFKQSMEKETNPPANLNTVTATATTPVAVPASARLERMLLPQTKNVLFQDNFTHPLNFLCLLSEELLRPLVAEGMKKDPRLEHLFGYTNATTPLKHDLSKLKICFGHFGGDDEWKKYFENDRDNWSSQLYRHPDRGIEFLYDTNKPNKTRKPGKPEQIWKSADWYTIICSLMLQYPNVFADISYILHNGNEILPLLKQTLQHPTLKQRVLYGTDFYVVRNHKSDKNMEADMMGGLSKDDFDLIARENPLDYLNLR